MKTSFLAHFILLFLAFYNSSLFAQNNLFFSSYGNSSGSEIMESIIQTSDGNLLATGSSSSFSIGNDDDLIVMKTDINGNIIWSKTYGGTSDDMGIDLKETSDGGFIVAGWTQSYGAVGYDFWVVKCNITGAIQWEKRFGGNGEDQAWSVTEYNNNYYVVGGTTSFGAGLSDLWTLKLDSSGNILWQKTYGTAGEDAPPSPYGEYVARGTINNNGDLLISAITDGTGHGLSDIYLAKINPANGNIIWQYAYGDSDEESTWNFAESPNGGYFLHGSSTNPVTFEADLWVVYVDSVGSIVWQKTIGIASKFDEALNGTVLSDGSIVLSSYLELSTTDWVASAIKLDANSNLIWANTYKIGHLDWTNAACELNDSTIAFIGVRTDTSTWEEDVTLFRTNNMGNIQNCNLINTFSPIVNTTSTIEIPINLTSNNTSVLSQNTNASTNNVTVNNSYNCSQIISSINPLLKESKENIFPNPTTDNIIVEFSENQFPTTYALKNITGHILIKEKINNNNYLNLNMPRNSGIYFLELIDKNGVKSITKIVKQ